MIYLQRALYRLTCPYLPQFKNLILTRWVKINQGGQLSFCKPYRTSPEGVICYLIGQMSPI